jgi:hypothetical protein
VGDWLTEVTLSVVLAAVEVLAADTSNDVAESLPLPSGMEEESVCPTLSMPPMLAKCRTAAALAVLLACRSSYASCTAFNSCSLCSITGTWACRKPLGFIFFFFFYTDFYTVSKFVA